MDGEGSSFGSEDGAWTVGSLWHDIAGRQLGDELLEWAPDLFAFTDVVLDRSEAYRVLQSARNQYGSVDIVVLPESVLRPGDIDQLETLLTRHGVWLVVARVRESPDPGGRFGANWLHLGVWFGGRWWHYRQNKHNRWSLDDNQIEQYHLAAALPAAVRWWEAMAVPRRVVQVVELDEASPWYRLSARIWPASTRWPTCFGPSGRPW